MKMKLKKIVALQEYNSVLLTHIDTYTHID